MVFENIENTKNKNASLSPNKFFVFFVFKNRKQFLKAGTKQTLRIFKTIFDNNFLFFKIKKVRKYI